MTRRVAVVGGGPAGLMAAEALSGAGVAVDLHDRMPSLGRKLLMAGRGGLNLTHSEPLAAFLARYGEASGRLRPIIEALPPSALAAWAEALGQPTFVGSSGRVFPVAMKASPLLRAWLARLAAHGVRFRLRRRWTGWTDDGGLRFETGVGGVEADRPDAVVLALGGASWPRLGSDGAWNGVLGAATSPLRPANGGFRVDWSPAFAARFAGQPLKGVLLRAAGGEARGELVIARYGLEGGAVYALAAALRDEIERKGFARLLLDLRPDLPADRLAARIARTPTGQSVANRLRKAGLTPLQANLLREAQGLALPPDAAGLAALVKAVPLTLRGTAPLERAISTAGGVLWSELDEGLMLKARPGVFLAGEMLDWEAPTGGYLLQACFATGAWAGRAAARFVSQPSRRIASASERSASP